MKPQKLSAANGREKQRYGDSLLMKTAFLKQNSIRFIMVQMPSAKYIFFQDAWTPGQLPADAAFSIQQNGREFWIHTIAFHPDGEIVKEDILTFLQKNGCVA